MSWKITYKYHNWNNEFITEDSTSSIKSNTKELFLRMTPSERRHCERMVEMLSHRKEFWFLSTNTHFLFFIALLLVTVFLTLVTLLPFVLVPMCFLFWIVIKRQQKLRTLKIFLDEKYDEWKLNGIDIECHVEFSKI